ncbi:hypothetical protein ILUMI_01879 [Ignelater luminosus]|uniref:DUF5641 domain-containing protein n=1 Tax=Ignelater luminosus TaxID=2038154 RepID=A0A8K0DEH8_IGNLU|nr:hypothetical protein ILUMI_01879 [Ignelater luminosus]
MNNVDPGYPGQLSNEDATNKILKLFEKLGINSENKSEWTELTLESGEIEILPKGIFDEFVSAEYIGLECNLLKHLQDDVFAKLRSLKEVYLHHNNLTEIPEKLFEDLSEITTISLRDNNIESLDPNVFKSLFNLNKLDLSSNMLREIPEGLFDPMKKLVELNLFDNIIEVLNGYEFKNLQSLNKLHLNFNNIRDINNNCFSNLEMLEELLLDKNKLTSVSFSWFRNMKNLNKLRLDDSLINQVDFDDCDGITVRDLSLNINPVKYICKDFFNNVTITNYLNLSACGIERIEERLFENLTNLKDLCLDDNPLTTLTNAAFSGLTLLTSLSLSECKIEVLPLGIFKDLSALESLDIFGNELTCIKRETFDGLVSLQRLILNGNKIDRIEEGAFEELVKLDLLNLHSNKISVINRYVFKGLNQLTHLYMDDNQIEGLSSGVFKEMPRLRWLSLTSNVINLIEQDAFEGLSELDYLDLDNNRIQLLHSSTFDAVDNLSQLILKSNRIEDINSLFSSELPYLVYLNVSCNKIKFINSTAFDNIPNIYNLELSKNEIEMLPHDLFSSVKGLALLDLGENKLTEIDHKHFEGLSELRRINLKNNKIQIVKQETFIQTCHAIDSSCKLDVYLDCNNLKSVDKKLLCCAADTMELHLADNSIENIEVTGFDPSSISFPSQLLLWLNGTTNRATQWAQNACAPVSTVMSGIITASDHMQNRSIYVRMYYLPPDGVDGSTIWPDQAFTQAVSSVPQPWKQGTTWDQQLDPEISEIFMTWMEEIRLLSEVKILRWLPGCTESIGNWTLHIISDAGFTAYGSAAFLKVASKEEVRLPLVPAKARVAPIKKPYYSQTGIAGSTGRCEPWVAYVYNMVREIRELTCRKEWRHVPGTMNPANLVSRGQPEESWPLPELTYNKEEINSDRKKNVVSALLNSNNLTLDWYYRQSGHPVIIYSDRGSNFIGFGNACEKLDWSTIQQYSSARRLEWHFNPPASPGRVAGLRDSSGTEYLGQLKLFSSKIVLMGNDDSKRIVWPLARNTETIKGKYGRIRVVKLKTAAGELTLLIQRVYPLELELKSDGVSKAVGERLREAVEEYVILDSCPGTSDPDEGEELVKSSEVYENKTRSEPTRVRPVDAPRTAPSSSSLDFNLLKQLEDDIFVKSRSLKEVCLENNKLTGIPEALFKGLSEITTISLSHNDIESLDPNVFRSLCNLNDLNLSYNMLRDIPEGLFDPLENLTLGDPKLEVPPFSISNDLSTLEILTICNSELTSIAREAFDGLLSLKKLVLNTNTIENVEEGALTAIDKKLLCCAVDSMEVHLADNSIENIEVNAFDPSSISCPSQLFLWLNGNNLSIAKNEYFSGLVHLTHLILSRNNIESVGTFDALPSLVYVDLGYNKLNELDVSVPPIVTSRIIDLMVRLEIHSEKKLEALLTS